MPFHIYGCDSNTGERRKRLYSDAETEEQARAEALELGMQADAIVACPKKDETALAAANASEGNLTSAAPGLSYVSIRPQQEICTSLSKLMRIVAVVTAASFGIICLGSHRVSTGLVLQGLTIIISAILMWRAARRFGDSGNTVNDTQSEMIEALRSLRTLYLFQVVAVGITFAFVAVMIVYYVIKAKF